MKRTLKHPLSAHPATFNFDEGHIIYEYDLGKHLQVAPSGSDFYELFYPMEFRFMPGQPVPLDHGHRWWVAIVNGQHMLIQAHEDSPLWTEETRHEADAPSLDDRRAV